MKLIEIEIHTDGGPWAEHNYPCPIFWERPSVYELGYGIFSPSWEAQKKGWKIVKVNGWLKNWILDLINEKYH